MKFGSDDMGKRFLASGRTGFYLAVTREGEVGAGDEIRRIDREEDSVPFSEIARLYVAKNYSKDDLASLKRVMAAEALPDSWKEYFRERIERTNAW